MEHIQDVYTKKPEMIEKIFNHLTKVNLKVDGKPFQVLYNEDTDELEYHGRSGNETKVGPMIDDMYRLFSKPINDAIKHIEARKEVFKKYKFLTFEVISEMLLLTAIITKDGEFIDDPDKIDSIAEELDTDVMPCLWKGRISAEQKHTLMEAISTNVVPTKDEFVKWVKALFGTYEKFPKTLISRSSEYIEGIVFFYNVDGKVVEYKLVDPTFRQSVKDNQSNMKADNEANGEKYKQIYEIFVDWAKDNASKLDNSRMKSIELNFIEMMEDPKRYNKLMSLATGLTTITTDAYFLQPDRISDELKKAIQKHGKVYQLLYEKFVRLFWKAKKRNFTISKEFQQDVNKICGMVGESLEDNEELIVEKKQKIYSEEEIDDKDFDAFKTFVLNTKDKKILAPYISKWKKSSCILSDKLDFNKIGISSEVINSLLDKLSNTGNEIIVNMLNNTYSDDYNNEHKCCSFFTNKSSDGIFPQFDKSLYITNINVIKKIYELTNIPEEDIDKIFNSKLNGVGKGELLFKLLCSDIKSANKGDLILLDDSEIECKCNGCLSNGSNKSPIKHTLISAFKECCKLENVKANENTFEKLDFSTKDENNQKTSLDFYWKKLINGLNEKTILDCIKIFDQHLKNTYINISNESEYLIKSYKSNQKTTIENFSRYLGYSAISYYAEQEKFKYLLIFGTSDTKTKIFATLIDINNFNNSSKDSNLLNVLRFGFSATKTNNGGGINISRIIRGENDNE